jgi:hypothetical protein
MTIEKEKQAGETQRNVTRDEPLMRFPYMTLQMAQIQKRDNMKSW